MSAHPLGISHLIFDLDDTLLDTYRLLLPRATEEAFRAMIEAGLRADLADCHRMRSQLMKIEPRSNLYPRLARHFGVRDGATEEMVVQAGLEAFYRRDIDSNISLFPGADQLLSDLGRRYSLHLVTAGDRATQARKVAILGLEPRFRSIHYVEPARGERKQAAFTAIIHGTGSAPATHLSIGNRLDTDIAEAKRVGCRTCWMRYGEYAEMKPASPDETPDFQINGLVELASVCRL